MIDLIVDIHSHLFPRSWQKEGNLPATMFDVQEILDRQLEGGIDVTIVSDPHIWYGDLDLGDIENVRTFNDFAAELARDQPTVHAMATCYPWRGAEQIREVERALTELDLPGVALATNDGGRYLDEVPDEFWDLVIDHDAPVFIHPPGSVLGHQHMTDYRLGEICGRPLDTTLSLARFILTGKFAQHQQLKLVCAHAGGAITTLATRLDFGHELRDYSPFGPWGPVRLERKPSEYISQLYLDTVTFGSDALSLALRTVGAQQLCFGTDGPPVPFLASRNRNFVHELGLDADDERAVLGGNAVRLFGLRSL
ncbi:amidohydrolase family protein [Nocardia sp. R6R-6]|uniref:amidohydrolase family protein n=1 Tax=Nocardia sp. R6R-6 TaxID=3459303 RepID=UPI00403DF9D5